MPRRDKEMGYPAPVVTATNSQKLDLHNSQKYFILEENISRAYINIM
jgi:hypothetical protein